MNRKDFLRNGVLGTAGMLLPGTAWAGIADPQPYDAALVREFVSAGHGEFEKVKSMLADYPNLLYACQDWGNGDFETALEGAGHVGHVEIAEYLIDQGARPNLFVLTMLGKAELVKPMIEAFPKLLKAKGAHGLTLLYHAQKGGKKAEPLANYLLEKGLTEMQYKIK